MKFPWLSASCGGGITRDILLGLTPPAALVNPLYLIIATLTSLIIFFLAAKKLFSSSKKIYEIIMLLTDSIGLGIFTVCGIKIAFDAGFGENLFLIVFVAVITGVGGGVLRDIFAGQKPYIFVKHVYACAAIAGAVVCAVLYQISGEEISMLSGFAIIIAIRLCAAKCRWSLPKANDFEI